MPGNQMAEKCADAMQKLSVVCKSLRKLLCDDRISKEQSGIFFLKKDYYCYAC
jgi:hypothetical protein